MAMGPKSAERIELLVHALTCSRNAHIALSERDYDAAAEWIQMSEGVQRQLDKCDPAYMEVYRRLLLS